MGQKTKKYSFLILFLIVFILINFSIYYFVRTQPKTKNIQLNVLAYSSFFGEWGPGPEVAQIFFKENGVRVNWIKSRSSSLLIDRIRFSAPGSYDLVIGLDDLQLESAAKLASWKGIFLPEIAWTDKLPFGAVKRQFIPIDWSVLSFVYRKGEVNPPRNFEDLLDSKFKNKLFIQDPRTSSPGLHFLGWVLAQKGETEAYKFFKKLKSNWKRIPLSWTSSYKLFQTTEASIVFSYITSPIYHWEHEKDFSYKSKLFEAGNPYQIEYAAVPRKCVNCLMATKFVKFLLRPDIQKILMEKNYMFPVIKGVTKGTRFHDILKMTEINFKNFEDLEVRKEYYLNKWEQIY